MGGYVVHGGEQSAAVVVPELSKASGALDRVAGLLTGAVGIGGSSAELHAGLGEPSLSPFGAVVGMGGEPPSAHLSALQGACRQAWDAVGAVAREAHGAAADLSADLVTAAQSYARAEQDAIQQIDVMCSPLPSTLGWAAVAQLVQGLRNGDPPEQRIAAEALATILGSRGDVRAGENAHESAPKVTGVTGGLAAIMAAVDLKGSGAEIKVGTPQGQKETTAAGLPTMIDLQMAANKGEDGSGAIVVTRMSQTGGSQQGDDAEDTWVVTVPGTMNDGDAVWGNWRLPQAMGSDTRDVSPAVMEAMEKVGVPKGAKIVLNGHSQGGRHALNLATDPDLSSVYRIEGVVTAGAPSGTAAVKSGMTVVQLEDPDDSVPGLDGSTWVRPTRDRFLVRSTSDPAPRVEGKDPGIFGWEHKGGNYRDLAEDVQAGTAHPELSAAVAGLGIGATAGVAAKSWVVPTSQAKPITKRPRAPQDYSEVIRKNGSRP